MSGDATIWQVGDTFEVFPGPASGRGFRHAAMQLRFNGPKAGEVGPGAIDDSSVMHLWCSADTAVLQVVNRNLVEYEARAASGTYRSADAVNRSVIVRSGLPAMDHRAAFELALGPAYTVLQSVQLYGAGNGGEVESVADPGHRTRLAVWTARDGADLTVAELAIDGSGLPRRAVMAGELVEWLWTSDQIEPTVPSELQAEADWFLERYIYRQPVDAKTFESGELIDFDYQSSRMDRPVQYVAIRHDDQDAIMAIRKGVSPDQIPSRGATALIGSDDASILLSASTPEFGEQAFDRLLKHVQADPSERTALEAAAERRRIESEQQAEADARADAERQAHRRAEEQARQEAAERWRLEEEQRQREEEEERRREADEQRRNERGMEM